ncbi:UvrD-helicase domain-containing protein [Natrarchaeobius chitinivorans]|uniref:DNA 3'-5' helicase n=1 Tax=Natrarchaeobius chitinivorans TaxID=1679083 RepID=A0A3N6M5F2_NATCH|nr:UvrD-helicase domain-containing protein [Natrarchaeobius chitinivorans]RQG95774.1 ATP-dependent helicase [Natrarchaeobius chitinivorans]
MTDRYDAPNVEHMDLPEWLQAAVPEELEDAKIAGGGTHPPTESVRLNGPPGTGKTTQQALRLAYLIEEEDLDPEEDITLVTYRRALANEVETRLKKWGVLSEDVDLKYWTTIHAACNRANNVLDGDFKNDGGRLGPAVTGREKYVFCAKELGIQYKAGLPWEDARGELLLDTFSWLRNNLLDPADRSDVRKAPQYDNLKDKWPGVSVPTLWGEYQDWKDDHGFLDFHELLEAGVVGELPPTDVVVIDEYHDVTPLMAKVSERWIEAADTVIVAGDPLQVVNSYAGADPRFFTQRLDHLPEVLLGKSWRVPEEHWHAASRMLSTEFPAPPVERDGHGKIIPYNSPIFAHDSHTGEWTQLPGESIPGSPAAIWVEHIDGEADRSMLILVRTQQQAIGVSRALDKAGIIHDAQDDVGGWDDRRVSLYDAMRKLDRVPRDYAHDTHHGIERYGSNGDGTQKDPGRIRLIPEEAATLLEHTPVRTLEIDSDRRDRLVSRIRDDETPMRVEDLNDEYVSPTFWERFTGASASVSNLIKAGELEDHDLEALRRALSRNDGLCSGLSKTRVLTIHASKGSEATDVVLYDGITSRISREMERSQRTKENEARTWYVALTRASERLHLMFGGFDWMQPHLPQNLPQIAASRSGHAVATDGGETR